MSTTNNDTPMWAIFNKEGSRLFQYGSTLYEDEAMRLLKKAQEKSPEAGCHLQRIERI